MVGEVDGIVMLYAFGYHLAIHKVVGVWAGLDVQARYMDTRMFTFRDDMTACGFIAGRFGCTIASLMHCKVKYELQILSVVRCLKTVLSVGG